MGISGNRGPGAVWAESSEKRGMGHFVKNGPRPPARPACGPFSLCKMTKIKFRHFAQRASPPGWPLFGGRVTRLVTPQGVWAGRPLKGGQ